MADAKDMVDTGQPVFDLDDFLRRIDGDTELLIEVLGIFLDDTPGLMADLIAGMKSKNATAVERAAHTLKGAAANISACRLSFLCQQLQMLVRKDANADLPSLITLFEQNFRDLDQALRLYLNK